MKFVIYYAFVDLLKICVPRTSPRTNLRAVNPLLIPIILIYLKMVEW